jgi:CRISPR/Cas system-associated protein Cas5 (RAMP superfamily)
MDTQIWYALFSTLIGGIYGAYRRLGEVGKMFCYQAFIKSFYDWFDLLDLLSLIKQFSCLIYRVLHPIAYKKTMFLD